MDINTTLKETYKDTDFSEMNISRKIAMFANNSSIPYVLAEPDNADLAASDINSMRGWIKYARQSFQHGYTDFFFADRNVNILEDVVNNLEDVVGLKWGADQVNGYSGKFMKRLGRALCDAGLSKPVSNGYKSELGDRLGSAMTGYRYHVLDATQYLDWEDGDFGDEGSCYWDDMSWCRELLEEEGAYAFRLFGGNAWRTSNYFGTEARDLLDKHGIDNEDVYPSFARCWAAVGKPTVDSVTIFNTYGIEERRMARVVASFLGLSHVACYVADTNLYMNCNNFLLASQEYIESKLEENNEISVSLHWYGNEDGDYYDDEDY